MDTYRSKREKIIKLSRYDTNVVKEYKKHERREKRVVITENTCFNLGLEVRTGVNMKMEVYCPTRRSNPEDRTLHLP
jgi:hypothetical protein